MKATHHIVSAAALFFLFACAHPTSKKAQPNFVQILEDTTGNRRARWDRTQFTHYTNICKAIGIRPLCDGAERFEVRAWKQFSVFGMAADEEIYSLKVLDTSLVLTFYRVYCKEGSYETGDYKYWNPFTQPVVDSFFAVSKTFPRKIAASLDLPKLWDLKTQSALHISDSVGFLDGTVTSIELASPSTYKLIRYHEARAYYQVTKIPDIQKYVAAFDALVYLFQSNRVYK